MLAVAIEVGRTIEALNTTIEPTVGTLHGFLRILAVSRARTALVESHDDIRTYLALDIHDVLRGEHEFASVDMRGELHTLFGHLAYIGEGEYLKTSRVGEDRTCPSLETMQTTSLVKNLRTRTEIKVIGVAENDLRLDILFEESALYTLDGTNRTNRHKNRGLDIPMVSMYHTRACARVRICMYKVEKNFLHSVEIR